MGWEIGGLMTLVVGIGRVIRSSFWVALGSCETCRQAIEREREFCLGFQKESLGSCTFHPTKDY